MENNLQKVIEQFVDFLLPSLTPYESGLYIFLLRNAVIKDNTQKIRIGKRTIANNIGSARGEKTNYAHITKLLLGLEQKQCIKIGDTNREGTSYFIYLPEEIPLVKEILSVSHTQEEEDYFTNIEKRKEIFERDEFTCHYCGIKVNSENVTLDHLIPQHAGGTHTKENLKTSCLTCNSIKSGKSYEEAAPFILKSIQERRKRNC